MDNLDKALKDDAQQIEVAISPELDDRIRASLENVTPMRPDVPAPRRRPMSLWWASSLTGVAAAIGIIAMINVIDRSPGNEAIDNGAAANVSPLADPIVLPELSARTAMLASPLEQELEHLESNLIKARDAVRRDLGFDL